MYQPISVEVIAHPKICQASSALIQLVDSYANSVVNEFIVDDGQYC